jgi:TPP-dependent pyruvate/acetoin dehydrogenase alpha subunit
VSSAVADARRPREVLRALQEAASAVRAEGGPQFVEANSEPWPGNATFIPRLERPLDLTSSANGPFDEGDPVRCEAQALLDEGVSLDRLLGLDASISERMRAAFDAASAAPGSPPSVGVEHVWG